MSSDLSIGAVASDPAIRTTAAAPAEPVSSTSSSVAAPGTPNPTLRLDPALGLVVIEFLGKSGAITSSIPTQRELTAYQDGTAQVPGAPRTPAVHQQA
jgi:hypothetical protein